MAGNTLVTVVSQVGSKDASAGQKRDYLIPLLTQEDGDNSREVRRLLDPLREIEARDSQRGSADPWEKWRDVDMWDPLISAADLIVRRRSEFDCVVEFLKSNGEIIGLSEWNDEVASLLVGLIHQLQSSHNIPIDIVSYQEILAIRKELSLSRAGAQISAYGYVDPFGLNKNTGRLFIALPSEFYGKDAALNGKILPAEYLDNVIHELAVRALRLLMQYDVDDGSTFDSVIFALIEGSVLTRAYLLKRGEEKTEEALRKLYEYPGQRERMEKTPDRKDSTRATDTQDSATTKVH